MKHKKTLLFLVLLITSCQNSETFIYKKLSHSKPRFVNIEKNGQIESKEMQFKTWYGIPVISTAIEVEENTNPLSYTFITESPLTEVREFYSIELINLGWMPFRNSELNNEWGITTVFKDDALAIISISDEGGKTKVIIILERNDGEEYNSQYNYSTFSTRLIAVK